MAVRLKVFKLYSAFVDEMKGVVCEIEVSIRSGIPTFDVIGLCDSSIKECRGRIQAAVISSGFTMPSGHVTVNISPAYIKKSGTCCELAIALGLLAVSGQIAVPSGKKVYAEGELSLTGDLRGTPGSALRMKAAADEGFDYVLIPSGEEAGASVNSIKAMCVKDFFEAAEVFMEGQYAPVDYSGADIREDYPDIPDISFLKGQEKAKRAILIAAAGRHNLMLLGSAGCGKTLAGRLAAGIMPPMSGKEKCDVYALNEALSEDFVTKRPFRYIHPGISAGSLVGSLRNGELGECVLANHGILFADEIYEFRPQIIELLRIPLEERCIYMKNSERKAILPASFMFIGAGNPCKCGNLFEKGKRCTCTPAIKRRYQSKLSGPFLDRIDLFTEMRSLTEEELQKIASEGSDDTGRIYRELTSLAQAMQQLRYGEGIYNGTASHTDAEILRAPSDVVDMAVKIATGDGYSARGFTRLLRVGRTIADIDGRDDMRISDVTEAALYRNSMINAG